jgi:hypothetical protein
MMRSYDASQQGLFRTFAPADGDTAIGDIFGGRQDIRTGGVQFDQPHLQLGRRRRGPEGREDGV